MIKIAILASGSGSNAEAIMQYFRQHPSIEVALVLSNNQDAGVLERAQRFNVSTEVVNGPDSRKGMLLQKLEDYAIDFVVLAGYMKLIPEPVAVRYTNKMLNIHPALLPKFGGKGMYGMHVHEAVVAAGERESGITIHYVNAQYDDGAIVYQESVAVDPGDTPQQVQQKVLKLEHKNYPIQIEKIAQANCL